MLVAGTVSLRHAVSVLVIVITQFDRAVCTSYDKLV